MKLKDAAGIGGIYLKPPGTTDAGEEYVYTISPKGPGEPIGLKVEAVRGGYGDSPRTTTTLYAGTADGFDAAAASEVESREHLPVGEAVEA